VQSDFFPKEIRCECCGSIIGYVFGSQTGGGHNWCRYCAEVYIQLLVLLGLCDEVDQRNFLRSYNSDSDNRHVAFTLHCELRAVWGSYVNKDLS
jgi:hypothetical protein